jgi:hypothetical protein
MQIAGGLTPSRLLNSGGVLEALNGATIDLAIGAVLQGGTVFTDRNSMLRILDTAVVDRITGSGTTILGNESRPGSLSADTVTQGALIVSRGSSVILNSNGGTSVLGALNIAGGPTPTGKLNLSDNAAIIDYEVESPEVTLRQQILTGRGGSGLGKTWNGPGITSSAAASANAAEPESRSIGYAENSALPLGPYTNFRGQPVDDTSVLMAFTRTGDANLDGIVNDEDVTIVSATYAPGIPQPHWALGDFDYNGFVDDADVTLLSALYDPSAPPLFAATAATGGVAAVPEPAALALGVTGLFILYPLLRRKKPRRFGHWNWKPTLCRRF